MNDENNRCEFLDISEIKDIIESANMGIWRIELVDGEKPRMFVDDTMKRLLGVEGQERSPEKTYSDWFDNIKPEAVDSVLSSVECMKQGHFDENTYKWIHPTKGVRYVRCGGSAQKIQGGYSLRGYHYDVDEVVRKEKKQNLILQKAINEKKEFHLTLHSLSGIFYSMHVVDLLNDTVAEINATNQVKDIVNRKHGATEMMVKAIDATITDDYKEQAFKFTDLKTLADRMKGKETISNQFVGKNVGWINASFLVIEHDSENRPTKVIFTVRVIDKEKKYEEILILKSQIDELTGLLNRRAYETDILEYDKITNLGDFAYVSMDLNGLKVINDTKGHLAGDEMIIGASYCMKNCLEHYGKVFRIGGDEFAAFLFCDEEKVKEVLDQFEERLINWSGNYIDELSISYGWISKNERPDLSVKELGAIADKRMYEAKSAHYKKVGFDRKGQNEAHKVLCKLYTKILKINITDDSYQIINIDVNEKILEKGFSDKISEWLIAFGKTGQVHPDDLHEYLRITDYQYLKDYFAKGKTSLHLFYRRLIGDSFKQVMMEIVPASDYSNDNQSLYLYVKDIDK